MVIAYVSLACYVYLLIPTAYYLRIMDGPTLVATLTAIAWIARNHQDGRFPPFLARLQRLTIRNCGEAIRHFAYERVYRPHRSAISLLVGLLLRCKAFECDCCCLRLGGQDVDEEYRESCLCRQEEEEVRSYCYTCITTYLETQVTEGHASKAVCMASRQCVLDDRLVRKRLSPTVTKILDRNQIMEAAAAAAATRPTIGAADDDDDDVNQGKTMALSLTRLRLCGLYFEPAQSQSSARFVFTFANAGTAIVQKDTLQL